MTKTLFIVEDPKKIDQIFQDSAKIKWQFVYISLSPSVSYAFEKFKIPFKSISDYGGGEERYQQGLENFERIERIVTILDKELAHLHNIPTLAPARYSIYNLKILFDVLWNTIHILKRIIETEQPDFIRLYATPKGKSEERIYAFSNDESVYAEVLSMPGWNIPIEIIQEIYPYIPDQLIIGEKNTTFFRLLAWIKKQHLFFNLGLIGKRDGIVSAAAALYYYITCWHPTPVLIYNNGYNWDDSLVELYRGGLVPVYRITDETFNKVISKDNKYREAVRKVCTRHPSMREFDQVIGIGISTFFFERLSQIIERSIHESIAVYPLIRRTIPQKKIHCLLHSVRERAIGHAIVQAAHDAGIPVVSWQHGGAGYCYHPMMSFTEFINSDWHFVFGEGVARSYRSTSESIGLEKIPIFVPLGSSSLDHFYRNAKRSDEKKEQKYVVFITSAYLQNIYPISLHYDLPIGNEHIWILQKQIMDLAKKNPDTEFIIKLHPTHKNKEPLVSYITEHEIKNIKIITSEMTIQDLIYVTDMMIFDVISTGILQVLTSDLPIFVYSGLHPLDSEPINELKKRAYVYDNIEEFIANIEKYLIIKQVTRNSVDYLNKDFLKKYGTNIQTHNSAGLAMAKLKKIISGYRYKQ